nr:3-oxoacyl-[acyl-carrier-protein] synthase, KASII (EC 2.3.1.179) [Kibdelosporangium sp. MJ126-NF4]
MIIGVGALTALGPTAADLWTGARDGRVAIGPVHGIPNAELGGQVRNLTERSDRALDLAMVAADEAMAALPTGVSRERVGFVLGTCNAGLLSARTWLQSRVDGEEPDLRLAELVTPQGLAESVAARFGLGGPVLSVSTACASGANAIGLAAELVRSGRVDAMLAGGTDALSDVVFAGFAALESLSPAPAAPYSATRSGLSLGEGAAMVVLLSDELAQGLPVLAEVAGYGLSADGHHPTAPREDGSGAAEAMRAAMRHAGVKPEEVGYVNGHGTGTLKNDSAETRAIRLALGAAADQVLVSSTKSVIGHLLGAAGAAEAVVTAHAVAQGIAPPTAGYTAPDPGCDLDYVPGNAKTFRADAALSNNFGFGGANASLVLTRADRPHGPPPPEPDRVVITGVGLLEADESGYVEVDVDAVLSRRDRRRIDRLGLLSVAAASMALTDAGLRAGCRDAERVGVLFGTGHGPVDAMRQFVTPLLTESAASPGLFPNTVYNQTAGHIAARLGLRGPTSTLSVGHATDAAVLAYATDLLATGHADTILTVVADTLNDDVELAYAGLLGIKPVEGGLAFVLERRRAAVDRGADILGEVRGTGSAFGHRHGMERAMRAALADADLEPAAIGSLWLAATGISPLDRAELRAVRRVFDRPPPTHQALGMAHALRGGGVAMINSSTFGGTHLSVILEANR